MADAAGIENTITFLTNENNEPEEWLRIGPDGFYVRGKKLKQDDREAREVYNSFTQWLAWWQLNHVE
jgi:hypothetical protein